MSSNTSTNRKLRILASFAALATLALAVSCRGFFVKPTVTSLAISPQTPSVQVGNTNNTAQMTAVATFNDGSTGTTPVTWSLTSGSSFATISSSGLLKSVAIGSGEIEAAAIQNPAVTSTTSFTVTVGCISNIVVTPTSPSISVGQTETFMATAQTCNGSQDVTSVATWLSSNTAIATMQNNVATAVAAGTTNITASSGGVTSSPPVVLTVNP
ncbi:MAG TPA: Ig-like domain-containing protein [Candidatus Sulfotelmatobacter sp.]|nr:Ig-like domain-containing protein [Candidatus Sulfotelmatobacter sp.]